MSHEGAQPETGLSPGQVASLEVVRGPDVGLRIEVTGARTVIGRRQGEVVLTDREISSVHAAIEASGGSFVVKDLGSTNGTFLEGKKVSSAPLPPGSHLKCGASYLRFDISSPAMEAAAPLIAAASGPTDDAAADLGLGPAPIGLDEDTPPPPSAPLVPPGASLPPAAGAVQAPEAFPQPPAPDAQVLEEIPTGIAPPSSVPSSVIPPASGPIPPAEARPIPPAASPRSTAPSTHSPPTDPESGAAAPPRVGVTSHGDQRTTTPGTPWDSLSLSNAEGAPIAPSLGGSPHVATPPPGAIQLPPDPEGTPPAPPAVAPPSLPAGVVPSPHDLYLVVEAGVDLGKVFPIVNELTVLGRSDLGLQIHDADVSRKHVALELQGSGPHLLRDLGSTNGTLLNGLKVTENLISPNDILRMGVTRLKLVEGPAALRAELARLSKS